MTFRQILLLISLLSFQLSHAEFVKWVDDDGVTHYGEKAPTGTATLEVDTSSVNYSSAKEANKGLRELNNNFNADKAFQQREQARKNQAAHNKKKHEDQCNTLKDNLRKLQTKVPVYMRGENGDKIYLPDQERATEIHEIEAILKRSC